VSPGARLLPAAELSEVGGAAAEAAGQLAEAGPGAGPPPVKPCCCTPAVADPKRGRTPELPELPLGAAVLLARACTYSPAQLLCCRWPCWHHDIACSEPTLAGTAQGDVRMQVRAQHDHVSRVGRDGRLCCQ